MIHKYHLLTVPPITAKPTSFTWVFWPRTHISATIRRRGLKRLPFLLTWDIAVLIFTVFTTEITIAVNYGCELYCMGTAGQLVVFVVCLGGLSTVLVQYRTD
jgi:hypothetical protein